MSQIIDIWFKLSVYVTNVLAELNKQDVDLRTRSMTKICFIYKRQKLNIE